MSTIRVVSGIVVLPAPILALAALAAFRADVTPPQGEPLIWVTPAARVEDPLWAKGIVLDDGKGRYVLCAMDWCGVGSSIYERFRKALADGAGTSVERAALQSVHQHTAPYVDGGGYSVLTRYKKAPLQMSEAFLERVATRLREAVKQARYQPFDRVGLGSATVARVASARRILKDGSLLTRFSTSGKDPEMAALPEGEVDALLRTVTFARGGKALVRLHYYATHPQTFCCEGTVTADFAGEAREAVEKSDGAFQVYFTGGAGDITVGKYNNGSVEARQELAARLKEGMEEAIRSTRMESAGKIEWRTAGLRLPAKPKQALPATAPDVEMCRAAIALGFAERTSRVPASALRAGGAWIVHLPGEPMLEFQKFAQSLRPREFVAVAGYGDISPGYLCTDEAYGQGGYEPSAANAGPGTERIVKEALRRLLQ